MEMTQDLVRFLSRVAYRGLPEEVIDRVKYLFLDFIGVTCRGSREDSSQTMYRFIRALEGGGRTAVMIGTRQRAPHLFAALGNGTSSHAIEMDDVNNEASLHPGVAVFPSALATCEKVSADGKRFIEGVVAGYEIMVRLGKALGPEKSYRRGFHPTGTCGVFGSSVASSKILRLGEEEMMNAMGIAGSQAAGSMEYLAQGAWTKRFHAGWAAQSGMVAAGLARKGFKGPMSILEGRDGFLHAYSDGANPDKAMEGIGTGFEILRTSVKPHSCCRYMQPPIDAILKTVMESDIQPHQVEKVRVGILRAGARLIAEPIERKRCPESIVDAQFSMPFGAAIAILDRKAGLSQFQLSKIRSGDVKQMMERVECFVNPELDQNFPKQWAATAEILTKDGKRYSAKIEYPKGDPENALSWEEMIDKFNGLSGGVLTKERRVKIVAQVRRLEEVRDFRRWASILLRNR